MPVGKESIKRAASATKKTTGTRKASTAKKTAAKAAETKAAAAETVAASVIAAPSAEAVKAILPDEKKNHSIGINEELPVYLL